VKVAESEAGPSGWAIAEIVHAATPLAVVVPVHVWAVAPVPNANTTGLPAIGEAVASRSAAPMGSVSVAVSVSGEPRATNAGIVPRAREASSRCTAKAAEVDDASSAPSPAKLAVTVTRPRARAG